MTDLLTAKEAALKLKVKPQTLALWRSQGRGPDYIKIEGAVRYSVDVLNDWVASQAHKMSNGDG